MSHGGGGRAKVTPNLAMDEEGTRMLNLTVLQRLDPAVEDILMTAAHVTLYDFDTNLNQWVGVSGPAVCNPAGLMFFTIRPDIFMWAFVFVEPEGCGRIALCHQEVCLRAYLFRSNCTDLPLSNTPSKYLTISD